MKTILVLGGSGNTGSRIAKLINEHSDSKVIIAGRTKSNQGWNISKYFKENL
jgi:saccharopine dehydrogenase-like NADP-dependent oxidoreductase